MAAVTEPRTSWNLSIVVSRVLVSPSCKYILVMASMMIVVVVPEKSAIELLYDQKFTPSSSIRNDSENVGELRHRSPPAFGPYRQTPITTVAFVAVRS